MFLADKNEIRRAFFDGETFSLNTLELSAFLPWFICEVPEFEDESEEAVCVTTRLIGDIKDLSELACNRKLGKTYVVSPGRLVSSENWSLIRLKSVSLATYTHEDFHSSIYRYETEVGQFIEHDLSGFRDASEVLNFQTILRFD
jgi:hypothetical protein